MKFRINHIALHLLCSAVFLLFPILSSPDFPHVTRTLSNPNGISEVFTHLILLAFFYLSYFYLIPKFYFRQRYFLFFTYVIMSAALLCTLIVITKKNFSNHHGPHERHVSNNKQDAPDNQHQPNGSFEMERPDGPPHDNVLRIVFFDYSLYMFVIVLCCALLLKTNQRWRKLQQEKLQTELSYLKAQINPHFLFNTLNSIYSLAIEKSDYTATAVVKLSGMMRYIISESHKNFVSLDKEVSYINDYIELQKFRLGGTVDIQYSLQGNYNGKEIAPLILITFVENAFKYGVNPEQYSKILVTINIENDSLTLKVENNKVVTSQDKIEVSGLGISNTRNRLEMLYPGKYKLHIDDGAEKFKVQLEVTLQ
jgi:Ca2+/Na+ antiporter